MNWGWPEGGGWREDGGGRWMERELLGITTFFLIKLIFFFLINWMGVTDACISFTRQILHITHAELWCVTFNRA